ncbi:MAG TPA: hypothetical protein PLB96_14900 [Syntrophales bacterium]|nr:hypothetical protein [Syntrophales bacterium]HOI18077.1 hypothetical protein [Geobacteraceae bacterium]
MPNHGKRKMRGSVALAIAMAFVSGPAAAQHMHHHGATPAAKMEHPGMSHQMSMADRPVQTANVQGMKVSLDVMDMGMHVHMQGMKGNPVPHTYDAGQDQAIMVMIQSLASKEIIKDADVSVTIVSPAGDKKTSKAAWCGDHYGESFSPSEEGTYQVIVRVEGREGKGETTFKYQFEG